MPDRLRTLLEKVEDWLLTVRKIRIPEDQFNAIYFELLRRKFSPAQMSMASLWIKFGKWPIAKKDIDLSDFYPAKEQISHLESEYVSRDFHIKRINSLKIEHEIEMGKLRYELSENRLSESDIQDYFMGASRIKALHDEIHRLTHEIKKLVEKNTILEIAKNEQARIIDELSQTSKAVKLD